MDFAIVLKKDKAGKVSLVHAGTDGAEADAAFQAEKSAGKVAFYRLSRGQAFRYKDLAIEHSENDHSTGTSAVDDVNEKQETKPVKASDLPGPIPGEIVKDPTSGQELLRTANNPQHAVPLPLDPKARAEAIKEAKEFGEKQLKEEVAPPQPAVAKEWDKAHAELEKREKEALKETDSLITDPAELSQDASHAPGSDDDDDDLTRPKASKKRPAKSDK